ncbi:plastocyanin/azurin family copper-binding protein [Solirubrobacter phytolaccae]|uniref:Plastocyanin/azurin family copper-binding protein n=1 Tax=Solirubrobacter phytolaccae TaxID=1404360 RepID=A0A9X3N8Z3_9ACTN|nr:plastocyanin/azurin family copper-binding protein [Solirubrobacter phytolaccae]MDA0180600.1 plastocyanin/azurin family copper-binding protein [Solirubrobacter phytolaccae]
MRTENSRLRRSGVLAATAALAAVGIAAGVGVAGARESVTIYSVENGATPCFSLQTTGPCPESPTVTIQTGEKVTWNFAAANGSYHNAEGKTATPANDAWTKHKPTLQVGGVQEFTFGVAGEYTFVCGAHPSMTGKVIVEGKQVETPTSTPSATPTETATATPTFAATIPPGATPTPDDHLTTPAPGKGAPKDSEAPRLQSVSAKRVTAGLQLRFWLSEQSTLSAVVTRKGAAQPVTAATLQVPTGTRALVLRTNALRKKGTYTVTLRPVDAMGNKGLATIKTLKVR